MRRLAFAAWCCALLGCDCNPPSNCGFTDTGERPVDPGGIESQPMTVQVPLALQPVSSCSTATVSSVSAAVLDPLDRPLTSTVTLSSTQVVDATAAVTFTPPTFGPYHLTVRFEPDLRTVQFDLLVAIDRSDAGAHSMPAPASCDFFDVAAGVPLCHTLGGPLTAYFPDGGSTSLDAGRFSVDEVGRVWTIDDADAPLVHAYLLDGGVFVELAESPAEAEAPLAMVARGGSAAVVRLDQLEFWRLDGGAFTMQKIPFSFTSFFTSGDPGEWCLQFLPPSMMAAVDLSSSSGPAFINGNVAFQDTVSGVVVNAGADDDGVWWTDGTLLNVAGAVLQNDAGVIHSLPFTGQLSFPMGCPESQQTPVTSNGSFVPRLSGDTILLEAYPIIGPPLGANSRIVWGVDGGTLYWFDRPALP